MVNREHKDRLFKMIFGRPEHREWTLSLYNAVNGTSYDDPSKIEFNTMEDVLFMGMKNDASFILDARLSIWEHQSTPAPNAPLRCLMYLGRLWSKQFIEDQTIYSIRTVQLPVPKCVVFYNGKEDEAEERLICLSEAFPEESRREADVELKVHLLNVNCGSDSRRMEKCRPMQEYAWLIAQIRINSGTMDIDAAVLKAIDEMPEDYLIRRFLLANKEEVLMSVLTEYDEEKTLRTIAREEREEGRAEGISEGQKDLVDVIRRMRNGESRESIIASGVDEHTAGRAAEVLHLFSPAG